MLCEGADNGVLKPQEEYNQPRAYCAVPQSLGSASLQAILPLPVGGRAGTNARQQYLVHLPPSLSGTQMFQVRCREGVGASEIWIHAMLLGRGPEALVGRCHAWLSTLACLAG